MPDMGPDKALSLNSGTVRVPVPGGFIGIPSDFTGKVFISTPEDTGPAYTQMKFHC